jgi:hypothetical protein
MNWMSNAARLLSMMKQEISTLERKWVLMSYHVIQQQSSHCG